MTRRKLLYYSSALLTALLAVIVGRADSSFGHTSDISGLAQVVNSGSPSHSHGSGHFDHSQAFLLIAAVESDDSDEDELSDRGKPHATFVITPLASPSRRATRMASSMVTRGQNTLNALCVRLQI